ncbi:hypothetical protein ACWXVX_22400, partial [Pantoea dispersa]|uniref:hypothetical protein n=1 Tax=Pantoea dispersa TaxID=59814 RepID=UPI001E2F8FCD
MVAMNGDPTENSPFVADADCPCPRRVRIHAHRYAIIYTHRFNRSNNPYRLSPMRIARAPRRVRI